MLRSEIRNVRSRVAAEARQLNVHTDWDLFLAEVTVRPATSTRRWRSAAAIESREFMRRLNLFGASSVKLLDKLEKGAPVIRVSHQPNLFSGLNIIGLIVLADIVAQETGGVVVFVGVDYDEAGDRRFRSSLVPNTGARVPTYLPSSVQSALRDAVACTIECPSQLMLCRWLDMHEYSIRSLGKTLGRYSARELERDRYETYRSLSRSLTEFNMAMFADLVKQYFNIDMLTVPASRLFGYVSNEIHEITDALIASDAALRVQLVWRVCPNCFRRCPAAILEGKTHLAEWRCKVCVRSAVETIDWSESMHTPTGMCPAFLPKITLDELIDYELAKSAATVSYAGGTEHIFRSRKAGLRAGFSLTHEYIWEPSGMRFADATTPLLRLWSAGKFSSLVYSRLFSQEEIRSEIVRSLAAV